MAGALVDNDVVIKIAAYGLGAAFVGSTTISTTPPAMLSVGRFVVRDRLNRAKRFSDPKAALASLDEFLPTMLSLEPTSEELELAAEFEASATKANLEFDSGESQLLAIFLTRAADLFITGDKRAIIAMGAIFADKMQRRTACFEQVVATLASQSGAEELCKAVCREPLADKAMSLCCACASGCTPSLPSLLEAIESYTKDLRGRSAGVLWDKSDLSSLAA